MLSTITGVWSYEHMYTKEPMSYLKNSLTTLDDHDEVQQKVVGKMGYIDQWHESHPWFKRECVKK